MILTLLGLAVVVVSTYFVYKTAKDYGRNALLWSAGTAVLGIGIQWILPFVALLVLAIVFAMQGTRDPDQLRDSITDWAITVSVASLALSGVAMWFLLKMVSKLPDEPVVDSPPPPPSF